MGKDFMKYDDGKSAADLLPPRALLSVGDVLTYGAKKYDPDNWRKTDSLRRYYGAAVRHLLAWAAGEDIDEESGLPALAHAACCVLFLLELQLDGTGAEVDDRSHVVREEAPGYAEVKKAERGEI